MKRLTTLITIALLPIMTWAADLTTAQMQTLKSVALADPTASTYMDGNHDDQLGQWFSESTTFVVWRTHVLKHEVTSLPGPTGTQFDWAGTGGYIARSTGERDAFNAIFNSTGAVNPSYSNVQAALADIFSGSGAGAVNNRAHFLAVSKRAANRAEAALSTGVGSTATPGTMTFEGGIDGATASQIRSQ